MNHDAWDVFMSISPDSRGTNSSRCFLGWHYYLIDIPYQNIMTIMELKYIFKSNIFIRIFILTIVRALLFNMISLLL